MLATTCSPGCASHRPTPGFSLMELLVVLAIILILMGITVPLVSTALARGKSTECQNNLKQWGLAMGMYLDEHRAVFPSDIDTNTNVWYNVLPPYVAQPTMATMKEQGRVRVPGSGKSMFVCPSSPVVPGLLTQYNAGSHATFFSSYALNAALVGKRLGQITQGQTMVAFIDSPDHTAASMTETDFLKTEETKAFRHKGRANVCFVDGHVRTVRKVDMGTVRWTE